MDNSLNLGCERIPKNYSARYDMKIGLGNVGKALTFAGSHYQTGRPWLGAESHCCPVVCADLMRDAP